MIAGYRELVIGGVFVAPFVTYVLAALLVTLALTPVLRRVPIKRVFANPSLARLCLYLQVLAVLLVLF
ncbi:DUF1656 domain-containing protein [Rhizosaccharibacter radicis]|uniref:DUF1656 domain-containing protein n=1 Tax=Rhizosaccharibacter radicis TaxID=2782605 RepID=A0ABT1W156_9PROT|nr:DUF1656 domain-containing protein [Acetobacteraceae bacterium KSS12]